MAVYYWKCPLKGQGTGRLTTLYLFDFWWKTALSKKLVPWMLKSALTSVLKDLTSDPHILILSYLFDYYCTLAYQICWSWIIEVGLRYLTPAIVLPVQRLQLLMVNCTFSFHEWVSAMTKVHGKTFGEPSKQVAFFVAWHASLLPKIDTTMTWWKKEFLVSLYKVITYF